MPAEQLARLGHGRALVFACEHLLADLGAPEAGVVELEEDDPLFGTGEDDLLGAFGHAVLAAEVVHYELVPGGVWFTDFWCVVEDDAFGVFDVQLLVVDEVRLCLEDDVYEAAVIGAECAAGALARDLRDDFRAGSAVRAGEG